MEPSPDERPIIISPGDAGYIWGVAVYFALAGLGGLAIAASLILFDEFYWLPEPFDALAFLLPFWAAGLGGLAALFYLALFLAARACGGWRIDSKGLTYFPFRKEKRFLAWSDVEKIDCSRRYAHFMGRGVDIPLYWWHVTRAKEEEADILIEAMLQKHDPSAETPFSSLTALTETGATVVTIESKPRWQENAVGAAILLAAAVGAVFWGLHRPEGSPSPPFIITVVGLVSAVGLLAAAVYVLAAGAYSLRGTWRFDSEGIHYEPRGREPRFLRWTDVTRIERTSWGVVLSGKEEKVPIYFTTVSREDVFVVRVLIWQNLKDLFANSLEPPSQAEVITEPWVFLGSHCLRAVLVVGALAYLEGGFALWIEKEINLTEELSFLLFVLWLLPPVAVLFFWAGRTRRASFMQRRREP